MQTFQHTIHTIADGGGDLVRTVGPEPAGLTRRFGNGRSGSRSSWPAARLDRPGSQPFAPPPPQPPAVAPGRIGLGATLVNFKDPAFRDLAGTTVRIEALAEYAVSPSWAVWLRPPVVRRALGGRCDSAGPAASGRSSQPGCSSPRRHPEIW